MSKKVTAGLFGAACLVASTIVGVAQAATITATHQQILQQANSDLQNGKHETAYRALLPLEGDLAGNPDYDYLLGRAALGAHEPTRAAFAFDRCLAIMPNNGPCRLGMAQTHIALNEKQSAEAELHTIRRSSPPKQIAEAVERYLGELSGASAPERKEQPLKVWAELAMGYDNNINVAPNSSSITIPGFAGLAGSFVSKKDKSSFGQAKLGASWQHPVSEHWNFVAGGNLQGVRNFQAEDRSVFEHTEQVGLSTGMVGRYNNHRLGLMAQGQNYQLSGENYRNLYGIAGQYGYQINPQTQLSGFVQYNQLDYKYSKTANLQNVNSVVLGASLARAFDQDWVLFGGFYAGQDSKAKSKASKTVESDYVGLRAGATWLFKADWQAGLNVMYENRDYGGKNTPLFGPIAFDKSRTDKQLNSELSMDWKAAKNVTLKARYNYIDNDSNIKTREYKRQIVSLGVRYDFF